MDIDRAKAVGLLLAAQVGDVTWMREILPPCGDPAGDGPPGAPGGATPLMAAAAGGHVAAVELLLERGADPARRDARGRCAASYARAAGHPHLAGRLHTVVDQEKTMW